MLSGRERDRLKVLHAVEQGPLTQREAGGQLGLSERWVRKLLARLGKEGDRGIVHRLRGRASNRRLPAEVQARAVRLVKAKYRDFGPTLAAEYLVEKHDLPVSKEKLRQWLIEAGLWKRKRRRVEEIHPWRARRSCCGELGQWDTSEHDWLEGRGAKLFLVAMIDDPTSRAWARLAEHDSTEENMQVLWTYLERFGRPLEFYPDKDSMFTINRAVRRGEDEAWEEAWTEIGRALRELEIGWTGARSPQAKGRIERFLGTAQDRLVKGLRVAGACTLGEANAYLEQEYLPLWNRRLVVEPAQRMDAHRQLRPEHDLAAILSQVEERVVANDYTIRYARQLYQIARAEIRPGLRGGVVRVERRLDGSLHVRFRDRYLTVVPCEARPQKAEVGPCDRLAKEPRHKAEVAYTNPWRNFDLHKSPPLWVVLRQERG